MTNEIKILLTINLEGGTFVRKSKPEILEYTLVKDVSAKKKIIKKGKFKHYSLEVKPSVKNVKLTEEAYNYMTSNEVPYFSKIKIWSKLKKKERLEQHLQKICEHNRGKSYTYVVLDD